MRGKYTRIDRIGTSYPIDVSLSAQGNEQRLVPVGVTAI